MDSCADRVIGDRRGADLRLWSLVATFGGIILIGVLVLALPENRGREPAAEPGQSGVVAAQRGGLERENGTETKSQEALLARLDQHYQRALVMLHAHRNAHALVELNRVLEIAPRLPEAYVNMGFALLGLERFQEAGHAFSIAIELRPEQANAYYGLAVALEAQNQLPSALGAMRTYLHRTPQQDPYRVKARSALWEWEAELRSQRGGQRQDRDAADASADAPDGSHG